MKKHPYAGLLRALADGAEIQVSPGRRWRKPSRTDMVEIMEGEVSLMWRIAPHDPSWVDVAKYMSEGDLNTKARAIGEVYYGWASDALRASLLSEFHGDFARARQEMMEARGE